MRLVNPLVPFIPLVVAVVAIMLTIQNSQMIACFYPDFLEMPFKARLLIIVLTTIVEVLSMFFICKAILARLMKKKTMSK